MWKQILIVDDVSVNRKLLAKKLSSIDFFSYSEGRLDFQVVYAKNGEEAINLVRDKKELSECFHLIFMDSDMPKCDGISAAIEIRNMGVDTPIIAWTLREDNIAERKMSGVEGYLAKQLGDKTEIIDTISRVITEWFGDQNKNVQNDANILAGQVKFYRKHTQDDNTFGFFSTDNWTIDRKELKVENKSSRRLSV